MRSISLFKEKDDIINKSIQEQMNYIFKDIESLANQYIQIYDKVYEMHLEQSQLKMIYLAILKLIEDVALLEYATSLKAEQVTRVSIPFWAVIKQILVTVNIIREGIYKLSIESSMSKQIAEKMKDFLEDDYVLKINDIRNSLVHADDIMYNGGFRELINLFSAKKVYSVVEKSFSIINDLNQTKDGIKNKSKNNKIDKIKILIKENKLEDRQKLNEEITDKNIEIFIYYELLVHISEYKERYFRAIDENQFITLSDVNSKIMNINGIISLILNPSRSLKKTKCTMIHSISEKKRYQEFFSTLMCYYAFDYIYSVYDKLPRLLNNKEQYFTEYIKDDIDVRNLIFKGKYENYYTILRKVRNLYVHEFLVLDFYEYREDVLDILFVNYYCLLNMVCKVDEGFLNKLNDRGYYIPENVHREIEESLKRKVFMVNKEKY